MLDTARSTVDNLFRTKSCRSFSVKGDDSGDVILTMRFKKQARGTPPPNNGQTYVPLHEQFTAYKKLSQYQNNRNRRRLENFYVNGRFSQSRAHDRTSGNWRGMPQGHHLNPQASIFCPRGGYTMHPPMSQPSVNPENTPQNNDEMHDAKSDVPFSQPESVTLNSVETFLLAGLNRMVEPCEQQEKSNVSISDLNSLNSSVQAISSSPDKPPDPPDSTSTSELASASVTSVEVLIDDHLVNEISVDNGQFLDSAPTSVDNASINDEMSEQFRAKYKEIFGDAASTTVSLKPDPPPD